MESTQILTPPTIEQLTAAKQIRQKLLHHGQLIIREEVVTHEGVSWVNDTVINVPPDFVL